MIGAPERSGRPTGVTVLGWLFLIVGAALLAWAGLWAAGHPRKVLTPPGAAAVVMGGVLPAVWSGTAGWGLLKGRAWARALVMAMAVLALVVAAGTVTAIGRTQQDSIRAGQALGLLAVTGGASLYLFGERAKGWFR